MGFRLEFTLLQGGRPLNAAPQLQRSGKAAEQATHVPVPSLAPPSSQTQYVCSPVPSLPAPACEAAGCRDRQGVWDTSGLEGGVLHLVEGDRDAANWLAKMEVVKKLLVDSGR